MSSQFDYIRNPPKIIVRDDDGILLLDTVLVQYGKTVIDENDKSYIGMFVIKDLILNQKKNYKYNFTNSNGGKTNKQNGKIYTYEFILYVTDMGMKYLTDIENAQASGFNIYLKENTFIADDVRLRYIKEYPVDLSIEKRDKQVNMNVFDGEEISLKLETKELMFRTPYTNKNIGYGEGIYGDGIYNA